MSNVDEMLKRLGQNLALCLPEQAPPIIPHLKVKPTIAVEDIPEEFRGRALTSAEMKELSEKIAANMRARDVELPYDPSARVQTIRKSAAPIINWATLSQEDVYNPEVPIEARAFMAGDPLKVDLKDKNYEARWVNKNPMRLGNMIAKGFMYVTANDLASNLQIEVAADASGHYCIDDIVLMRISKATYYPAIRAAHQRAVTATQNVKASARGMAQAQQYMSNARDDIKGIGQEATFASVGSDFAEAQQSGQMEFYVPGAK